LGTIVALEVLNALGLKCPHPILKVSVKAVKMNQGDILEIWGDSPTFEEQVRRWCKVTRRPVLSVKEDGPRKRKIQILI